MTESLKDDTPSSLMDTYANKLKLLPETVATTLDNGFRIATETSGNSTATVSLLVSFLSSSWQAHDVIYLQCTEQYLLGP